VIKLTRIRWSWEAAQLSEILIVGFWGFGEQYVTERSTLNIKHYVLLNLPTTLGPSTVSVVCFKVSVFPSEVFVSLETSVEVSVSVIFLGRAGIFNNYFFSLFSLFVFLLLNGPVQLVPRFTLIIFCVNIFGFFARRFIAWTFFKRKFVFNIANFSIGVAVNFMTFRAKKFYNLS